MSNGKVEALASIIERLSEKIEDLHLLISVVKTRTDEQNVKINNLEVVVDNLRAELKSYRHPYKPEPRYGG